MYYTFESNKIYPVIKAGKKYLKKVDHFAPVSPIHVVVRFTHAYPDIVADNDYAIFIQIPGLFRCQHLKNVFLTLRVLRNRWFINSFKTVKKTFAATGNW